MTAAASMPEVVRSLAAQLAAFEGLLLLVSGLHKLIRRDRARNAVHELAGVPRSAAPFAVFAVASVELLAGSLLWTPSHGAAGGALAMLVWGGYLGLMAQAIARGRREVDCGCSFGSATRPLGAYHLMRNAALLAAAFGIAAQPAARADSMDGPQILAAFTLLALYGALDQVMILGPPRAGELR